MMVRPLLPAIRVYFSKIYDRRRAAISSGLQGTTVKAIAPLTVRIELAKPAKKIC